MEKVHTPKRVAAQPGQRGKIALIAAGCAAAVLLAAYLGLCAWVGGSPNILKGVSVAGVPVGGLTREQALETLEDNLGQVSSVTLPLEYGPWEGEITAAAVRVDDQATVAQAWQTGRSNFLLQGASYLSHQLGAEDEIGLTLAWTDDGKAELEKKMDEADLQVGGALTNATYAMEGDKLLLTKGVTGVTIDREAAEPMVMAAMTEAVSDAMQGGSAAVEPVVLPAHETTPQEPDFDAMYQELHAEAKSAEIDPETLEVSDHVVGVDFDVNQAKTLFDAAAEGETVEIPLTITQPEETKEGLEGKLFRDLRSSPITTPPAAAPPTRAIWGRRCTRAARRWRASAAASARPPPPSTMPSSTPPWRSWSATPTCTPWSMCPTAWTPPCGTAPPTSASRTTPTTR